MSLLHQAININYSTILLFSADCSIMKCHLSNPFCPMSICHPIPEMRLFQTQGQGHGCDQRAMSFSQPSILLICFISISHQSGQQFLRNSYFEICPWNIQGQGHEWGQRSRSYIIPSIQPMQFLFVTHQLDQLFLRYGQNSVWPWKNISNFFKENLPK